MPQVSTIQDNETKMDLNFDIKRPILDSCLPKYCYLKYLSRAYVLNWNEMCSYPVYDDFSSRNVFFMYRQKGLDFSNVATNKETPEGNVNDDDYLNEIITEKLINMSKNELNTKDNGESSDASIVKCRCNLKFSTLECYVTPLSLTGLSRFISALKSYEINANSLVTELQAKAQAHCAANSFLIETIISKTQVSLKIPQISVFSLQCGLAEGDKITNAFSNALANPDEFITLSLFTICIYSIETQLIDSQTKTAAIFMIDRIDTQFMRLYNQKS